MPEPPFDYLPSEPWLFDKLLLKENGASTRVEMAGWAFPDPDLGMSSPGQFLLNGKPFPDITYPIYREDVGKVFWQRRNSACSGFECATTVPTADLYPDGAMELTFVNPGPPRLIPAQQSWFKFDPARELPLPDEARRFRVIGSTDSEHFTRGGFTDFKRLDAAVRFFTGRGFDAGPRILDFGVGCGRVGRYLSQVPGVNLTGFDIDADNIAWCNTHLTGKFVAVSVYPPTPLPSSSFDLVYGVSVFTHLREPMQNAWLAELARLCAPGAFLFMTVHSCTALDYAWQGPDVYRDLSATIHEQGLYVSDANHQLDGYAEHENEYVNVFHDRGYIQNYWQPYFEIVDVLPGYIYTHDLVVMRKRSSLASLRHKIKTLCRRPFF